MVNKTVVYLKFYQKTLFIFKIIKIFKPQFFIFYQILPVSNNIYLTAS